MIKFRWKPVLDLLGENSDGISMKYEKPVDLAPQSLVEWLRSKLADKERWRNQLEADALAFALTLDMAEASVSGSAAFEVPEAQIVQAARDLVNVLDGGLAEFVLPFGTQVTAHRTGSAMIAGRVYARQTYVPGLLPLEFVRRDAHGWNLESFRLIIYNWGASCSTRLFGLPEAALIGGEGVVRHLLEFPPMAELGGAVLQYEVDVVDAARFCTATRVSLEGFATSVRQDTHWLWRWRASIARRVENVRAAAQAGIDAIRREGMAAAVTRICIDGKSVGRADMPTLFVEYSGFDDALRRGRLRDIVPGNESLDGAKLLRAPLLNSLRVSRHRRLHDFGVDGMIDEQAVAIVRAAPEGEAEVIRRLGRDLETVVTIPTASLPRYATLFWREGVIRAEPTMAEGLALWSEEASDEPSIEPGNDRWCEQGRWPSYHSNVIERESSSLLERWLREERHCAFFVNTGAASIFPNLYRD